LGVGGTRKCRGLELGLAIATAVVVLGLNLLLLVEAAGINF
jgi:hypothetical protein